MKHNGKHLTIQEAVSITGKSKTTIYRWAKQGKIKSETAKQFGKDMFFIDITDLENFLGVKLKHDETDNETPKHHGTPWNTGETLNIEETIQKAIDKALLQRETQMMKPMEEMALYRVGRLEERIESLEKEKEIILQENEALREAVKALPGPVTEITEKLQKLEQQEAVISSLEEERQILQQEATEALHSLKQEKAEIIREKEQAVQHIREKAETIEHLQQEKDRLLTDKEIVVQTLQKQTEELQKQTEDLLAEKTREASEFQTLKAKAEQEEKDYIATIEELNRRLDEERNRPWWKRIFG